jgi:branched-chain amino acid transport system substrate-binding protein
MLRRLPERVARLFVVSVLCGACSFATANAAGPEPYTIYALIPLSGSAAYTGGQAQNALRAYEGVANAGGGINGQPVHFEVLDDQSKPQTVVELFNEVLAKHVPVVIGMDSQSECNALQTLAVNGPVVYCFTPGVAPPPGYLFAAGPDITRSEHAFMKYAHDSGAKRIALLVETDATGQRADKVLPTTLAQPDLAGLDVVAHEHFDPQSISVAAQIARIKAAAPQLLWVSATGTPFQTVLRGTIDAGLNVPILTSAANMDLKILAPFADQLTNLVGFNAPPSWDVEAALRGPLKTVVAEYRAAYKQAGYQPYPNDQYMWDPASIVVAALRKLGTNATAAQLHDFIEHLNGFPGLGGVYDFRSGNQHGLGDDAVIIVGYDRVHQTFNAVSKPGGAPLAKP